MSWYQIRENGVSVSIRVQPRASRNEICGVLGDELKIALTSPPVDGEANKACIEFLAKLFSCPKKSVVIESGFTGRSKRIFLESAREEDLKIHLGHYMVK